MTIYVLETQLNQQIALNIANIGLGTGYELIITSQYSHQPLTLEAECIESNSRYSMFDVTFPTGFGEEHKNGVYYWDLTYLDTPLQKGLIKIITEPGGGLNALAYNAGTITDERVSEVFFRPNY
jgi:hypothetical protein